MTPILWGVKMGEGATLPHQGSALAARVGEKQKHRLSSPNTTGRISSRRCRPSHCQPHRWSRRVRCQTVQRGLNRIPSVSLSHPDASFRVDSC